MIDTDGLIAVVAAAKGVTVSVKAAFTDLRAKLDAELANDPAAQAIVKTAIDDILANNQELADAIVANNPTPIPANPTSAP